MNTEELVKEAHRRRSESQDRLASYERSRAAYFNENESGRDGGVEAMDSAGRVTLRMGTIRSQLQRREGKVNLLTPIVDDYVSLRGVMPTVKVLPEDESEGAKQTGILRTRIVRAQFSNSDMETRELEMAWFLTTLGDGLYTLTPVLPDEEEPFRPLGVYVSAVDPAMAFPRFRSGIDREQLDDVFVISEISADQAESEYHLVTQKKRVEVIHYYGRDDNCLIVDETEVARIDHNLGFCPAEWCRNKQTGGRHAQSDIAGVIDQHNELQVMTEVMKDALIESTYSQLLIKDPVNVQEQFEVGPGAAPIVVQATGDARRIPPSPPPQAAEMIIDRQWENIQHQTGSAPVRTEGRIGGSNISARAINSAQGPMETRLAGWQIAHGQALQRIAGKILLTFYRLPEFAEQDTITIWGTEKGGTQTTTFAPQSLNGWWRCAVNYGAMVGSSNHEKAVVGLQLMGQTLVPGEWVLEQIGVDDPETLIKEAEAQQLRRMKMAQSAEGAGAGPPGGTPGAPAGPSGPEAQQGQIMQPAEQGQALAAGTTSPVSPPSGGGPGPAPPTPAQPAPTLPGFPALAAAPGGPASAAPPAPLAGLVQQAIALASPRLRGQVVSAVPGRNQVIQVSISDHRDGAIVAQAFRSLGLRTRIHVLAENGTKPIPV